MNDVHPVERLFTEMRSVDPYPAGVVALPARIAGTAFFPGGYGLWGSAPGQPLPPLPVGGVMILGHDFHSLAAFRRSYEAGAEVSAGSGGTYRMGATWRNLLALLEEAKIDKSECFFTNAYMGLRESDSSIGRFPGSRDASFVERCRQFFLRQLDTQRPRAILALGAWVPHFLAPLAAEVVDWQACDSLDSIDRVGPVRTGVRFDGRADSCTVVALTHPSLRAANVSRRRYRGLHGKAAELAMLNTIHAVPQDTSRV